MTDGRVPNPLNVLNCYGVSSDGAFALIPDASVKPEPRYLVGSTIATPPRTAAGHACLHAGTWSISGVYGPPYFWFANST